MSSVEPVRADRAGLADRGAQEAVDWLQIQQLTKSYSSSAPVLRGVDLALRKAEVVALLGPSGSGKTTLLSLLAGFLKPDAGRIVLGGRDATGLGPRQRRVGVMFQNYALFPHMSVRKNILFGLQAHKVDKAEQQRRLRSALELTKLTEFENRMPSQLSGGQQQRVALARALVIQPDLLLLDEPFSGLDAQVREGMRIELTRQLREIGATALVVTHDQADAAAMADRVAVIHEGRIAQLGGYDELYRKPATAFVASFVGESNWFQAVCEGTGPLSLRVRSASWQAGSRDDIKAGDAVDVMVRRSSVIGVRAGDDAPEPLRGNHLACTLLRLIPSGPALRMWVTVGERAEDSMVFDIAPGMVPAGLTVGDRLTLCLDPQWCRAFASTVDSAP
jgi:ABC-type Fe3+/spermidine/putrescine transport system ATPase subunit